MRRFQKTSNSPKLVIHHAYTYTYTKNKNKIIFIFCFVNNIINL